MSNLNELKPIINLNPFARFCCTIGNLPSSYMTSLTYEEQLMWLCDYLQNTVIPAVNNNAECVKELQELYVKLKNYVDNYFKNLDVQNEINIKLDEMAEDGTLENILSNYINVYVARTFNNLNDLKNYDLKNGMTAKTLGYYKENDGGCADYYITSTQPTNGYFEPLNNGNYALLLIKNGIVNVKQLGCYGDGINDDTLKLQESITFAKNNNYNVYIPNGSYIINSPIEIEGVNILGESTKETKICNNNSDGFLLKHYNAQMSVKISNISFLRNMFTSWETAGIIFETYTGSERSRGYVLENLYFYGQACAIDQSDSFRTSMSHIKGNNCLIGLFIHNQSVQNSYNDIVFNEDFESVPISNKYGNTSIGCKVGKSGETLNPEGIKMNHCCFTGFDNGLYIYTCTYFIAEACEFDICNKQAVYIRGGSANITIRDSYMATISRTKEPIVEIFTAQTVNYNPINIINNFIFSTYGNDEKIGIAVGLNNGYYLKGVNIKGNTISSINTHLKYGIYSNRASYIRIEDNNCIDSTTADIYLLTDSKSILTNNYFNNTIISVFANTTLYATGNIITGTKQNTIAGTLVGNFD